jgi:hypothetical protein
MKFYKSVARELINNMAYIVVFSLSGLCITFVFMVMVFLVCAYLLQKHCWIFS